MAYSMMGSHIRPIGILLRHGWVLYMEQRKHEAAKPLKGFGSAGVLEVVENWSGDTFRAVYTVRFGDAVYVLHCFQKKSRSGSETPKEDMEKIHARLKAARNHAEGASK